MTTEIKIPTNIFGKPVLRTEANKTEENRKATRLDLFFDLFFVAAIRVISHEFAHDLGHWSRGALVQTTIYIVAIWRLWTSITYFFERYKTEGLTKRFFIFIQMFLIAGVGLTIMGGSEAVHIFFLLYGLAKGGLAAMYLRTNTGHKDPLYCKNNRLQMYGNSIVLIASIIALFLPGAWSVWILLIALGFDVVIPILGKSTLKYLVPSFEVETYHERFGLFIIIVLGESILGAITGIHWESLNNSTLSIITAALILSFIHWWIYFEYVSNAKIIKNKILNRTYLHLPLTICFTLISATVLYLVEHSTDAHHETVLLLNICCIIVMITIIGFEKITGNYSQILKKDATHIRHIALPIVGMIFLLPGRGLSIQVNLWLITLFALIPIATRVYLMITNLRNNKTSQ